MSKAKSSLIEVRLEVATSASPMLYSITMVNYGLALRLLYAVS